MSQALFPLSLCPACVTDAPRLDDSLLIEILRYFARRTSLSNARILFSAVEEIECLAAIPQAYNEYERIRTALELGFSELRDLQRRTGIAEDRLKYLLRLMIDARQVVVEKQGGKTDNAGGSRKDLYRLADDDPNRPPVIALDNDALRLLAGEFE